MIYSTGATKTIVNDKVIEDSSWNLQSINDEEFNMKIKSNGKKYEIRNFTLDDLNGMISKPHSLEDINVDELYSPKTIQLKPYPLYTYKKTRSKRKVSKSKTVKRKKRNSSKSKKKRNARKTRSNRKSPNKKK